MKKAFAIVLILLCGCHDKPENLVEQQPPAGSLRKLLFRAVLNAERTTPKSAREDIRQRSQIIAEAALSVLAGHHLEELKPDEPKAGDDLYLALPMDSTHVRVEGGIIHVHGYNYEWRLFPNVVDGRIQQISKVEASPICLHVSR
jgi:hypothetical protein